ncbi:hypothetical protein ACLOJK_024306 [Asimina triloba]
MKSTASNPSPDTASTSPASARLRLQPFATARPPLPQRNRLHRPSSIISPHLACQKCLPSMLDADVSNTLACRHGRGMTPSTHGDDRHPRIEDNPATVLSDVAYK